MESIYSKGAPKKWRPGDSFNLLPTKAGEYKIFYIIDDLTAEQCAYVGFSGNIKLRIQQHNSKRYIDGCSYVTYKELDINKIASQGITIEQVKEMIREHEKETIIKYKPPHNKIGGGTGRSPNLANIESELKKRASKEEAKCENWLLNKFYPMIASILSAIKKENTSH